MGSLGGGLAYQRLGTTTKSAFSTNAKSGFASIVLDQCPGPPSAAHLMVSLYFCSYGHNTHGKSKVRDGDEEVAERNGGEIVFSRHVNVSILFGPRSGPLSLASNGPSFLSFPQG